MTNKFVLVKANGKIIENPSIDGLKIDFAGKNNYVEIHEHSKFVNTHIKCSNNSRVIIKKTHPKGISNSVFAASTDSKNNYIIVDENLYIASSAYIYCQGTDNAGIVIGRDNMWSSNVVIRGSDGHQILDLNTMDTINFAKETVIGNNVWIGSQATIMKGVTIPSGAIVGQGTIVTKSFSENNIAIAGNPGKVVRRNVGWNMDIVWDSEKAQKVDKHKEKNFLQLFQSNNYWEVVENDDRALRIIRRESRENDRWIKFKLTECLCAGKEYYLVFDFKSSISTKFTLFLSNKNNEIYRIPMFWVNKNVRKRIVYPFIPDLDEIKTISLSASHFPLNSELEINDFRIEEVASLNSSN